MRTHFVYHSNMAVYPNSVRIYHPFTEIYYSLLPLGTPTLLSHPFTGQFRSKRKAPGACGTNLWKFLSECLYQKYKMNKTYLLFPRLASPPIPRPAPLRTTPRNTNRRHLTPAAPLELSSDGRLSPEDSIRHGHALPRGLCLSLLHYVCML